ncbi:aldehyde dehydrogenase family protein [Stieleria marina]|uniref:L-glutamate gamma-semialdehyde dehydrogenase n=1 Tax=Stieleria marina TaxID=1930275 RepID=A0A517P1W4_9BACT|nr:N-succinylglutamate 5-semialdehyde dehydrogenase [Planctomycetes bacterium K23_9]
MKTISPIDDSIVWKGSETDAADVPQIMQRADQAGRLWRRVGVERRIEIVQKYASYLTDNRDEITQLIVHEVGKLSWDAAGEVSASIAKAAVSIEAMQQRRFGAVVDQGPPRRTIRYQPLGVAVVLGPFNFPLHLPGGQVIPALLSGNAVVMKPSEQATAVGFWMANAWQAAGLPEDVFNLIIGRVEPATAAIDSPFTKGVFLTGGQAAGQAIHRQLAGRYDVLLALELGGNNPIVVMGDVEAKATSMTVSFSAFISAGQRCTCARRAYFVAGKETDDQISELVSRTESLRVGLPGDQPPAEIGPVISAEAAHSLRETYDQLIRLGCKSLVPWKDDPRRKNLVHPMILDASEVPESAMSQLVALEWFGPLLVIHRVETFDDALEAAAATPYGLSAALLGGDQNRFDRFVNEVGAGVVNWNRATTGAAGTLPFGGLGQSGNHRPAGFHAIDFCSDPVASIESATIDESDPWSMAQ